MAGVVVVTDSSSCLPPSVRRQERLRVVPIVLLHSGGAWLDGAIAPETVYDALARDELVKSSPPTVIDYLKAIETGNHDAAVVLTPAAEFTIMHRNAGIAAGLADRPVEVVDTRTAAAAQGLVVMEAFRAADRGAPLAGVAEAAHEAAGRVELVATLRTLAWVERSGRVPADALGDRSDKVFRFRAGAVRPIAATRGREPLHALRQAFVDGGGADAALVFHARARSRAERLRRLLNRSDPIVEFSAGMAIHTGPDCVGVAWLRPEDQPNRRTPRR